ncbi:hypothetical protein HPP92_000958 [Vanilla planifolia]|uniref:EF-hand domain-containing protein n=1 Tax=Vanilla planifolia TaxID=51239 RepID=A0A835RZ04_VANPL|nr:hypothetical protein HPP92_000958 [Vanilla planifolia]
MTPVSFAHGQDEFMRLFCSFDADGDSKISPAELRQLMKVTVGEELSSEEAEVVLLCADSDADGLLDLEDFMRLAGVAEHEEERDVHIHLRQAFKQYEMDGEGCITAKSLKRVLSRLGASRPIDLCRAIIGLFDLDGDGVLSFDEFKAMMMRS